MNTFRWNLAHKCRRPVCFRTRNLSLIGKREPVQEPQKFKMCPKLWFLATGRRHNEHIKMKFWHVSVDDRSALAHQIWPSSVVGGWYRSPPPKKKNQNVPKIVVFGQNCGFRFSRMLPFCSGSAMLTVSSYHFIYILLLSIRLFNTSNVICQWISFLSDTISDEYAYRWTLKFLPLQTFSVTFYCSCTLHLTIAADAWSVCDS